MINALKKIGLTEYEANVYITLLKGGQLLGGIISRLSGVPHSKTYYSLNNLIEKGFVAVTPLKPKLFKAVEPETAIKHYLNERIDSLKLLENELPAKLQSLKKQKIGEESRISESIIVFAGLKQIWPLVEEFFKKAKKSVKYMFTYTHSAPMLERYIKEAVSRGVKVKIIATEKTKEGVKLMKEHIKIGAEVRYFPVPALRLHIRDDEEARQQIINPRNTKDRINIYIQHGELAKALGFYFDSIWKKAKAV